MMRSFFLACAQSRWLREQAPRYGFVRRTVARFMPGETVDDALAAAATLCGQGINTVFTHLGENITDAAEAEQAANHYIVVLDQIRASRLQAEISVKLTQLGLDLNPELCYVHLRRIIEYEIPARVVWVDMEGSNYTDVTLDLYRRAHQAYPNVGICLQAYLYRTASDLASLMPLGPAIRLVKGAYQEPPQLAYPRKQDVDENFFSLARQLLGSEARERGVRAAIATHDLKLIRRISEFAESEGPGKDGFEFQMLYGIQRAEQLRLAREGWRSTVLIAYGDYWFPWFMRRLAERPANAWFAVRNLLAA